MGIRDKPIAPLSPWQNGFAERLIWSIRRECLGHRSSSARGASPSAAHLVPKLLQRNQNASRASERRAELSPDRADWDPGITSHSRRTSPPIRPYLVSVHNHHAGSVFA
jgi:hypothetical protein